MDVFHVMYFLNKERIVVVAIVTDSPDSNSHHSMYYHRNNSNSALMEGNNVSRVIPKTTVCVRLKAPFTLYQTMSNDPIGEGNDVT